jgi:hypothetical protein
MKLVELIKTYLNETYIKIHACKNLYEAFPIQNGLKQGDAVLPLLLNFALEYAIRNDWKWMKHISSWSVLMMLM